MAQLGCEKCGSVTNPVLDGWTPDGRCRKCGAPLREVSLVEAISLVRERAEAESWRAQTRRPADARRL